MARLQKNKPQSDSSFGWDGLTQRLFSLGCRATWVVGIPISQHKFPGRNNLMLGLRALTAATVGAAAVLAAGFAAADGHGD